MARRSRLDIIIGAKTVSAAAGISKVNKGLGQMSTLLKTLSVGAAAGTFIGLGIAATKASFDFEALKLRLEAVTGSAKKSRKIFKEVFDLFIRSPLLLEPLLKARILLEGIGVRGSAAMKAVAESSVALGKNILEVAGAVASLETEPLRRMGIELRRTGEQGTITFRDRLNRQIVLTGRSTEQLRKQLLGVFGTKFSGFLGKAAQTGSGLLSTLSGSTKAALAQIGDPMSETIKEAIRKTNDALIKLLESRKFEELSAWFINPFIKGWDKFTFDLRQEGLGGALKAAGLRILDVFKKIGADILLILKREVILPFGIEMANMLSRILEQSPKTMGIAHALGRTAAELTNQRDRLNDQGFQTPDLYTPQSATQRFFVPGQPAFSSVNGRNTSRFGFGTPMDLGPGIESGEGGTKVRVLPNGSLMVTMDQETDPAKELNRIMTFFAAQLGMEIRKISVPQAQ